MSDEEDRRRILEVMVTDVQAFEKANADLMKSLFWVDDSWFIEVENHIPKPFDREKFLAIMDWMRKHQKPGWKMRFYDTRVHLLSPEVAYSISLRDQVEDGVARTSRVALVFIEKRRKWKIIPVHFSYVPE